MENRQGLSTELSRDDRIRISRLLSSDNGGISAARVKAVVDYILGCALCSGSDIQDEAVKSEVPRPEPCPTTG